MSVKRCHKQRSKQVLEYRHFSLFTTHRGVPVILSLMPELGRRGGELTRYDTVSMPQVHIGSAFPGVRACGRANDLVSTWCSSKDIFVYKEIHISINMLFLRGVRVVE